MKKKIIIYGILFCSVLSLLLLSSCTKTQELRNIRSEIELKECQDKSPDFQECKKDLWCYFNSWGEWSELYSTTKNFSCGLIVFNGEQYFINNTDTVAGHINLCITNSDLNKSIKKENITRYEYFKIYYYDDTGYSSGINKTNYNLSVCFFNDLFKDENVNVSKFKILNNCKQKEGI
jgi:hypothetical protein